MAVSYAGHEVVGNCFFLSSPPPTGYGAFTRWWPTAFTGMIWWFLVRGCGVLAWVVTRDGGKQPLGFELGF